MSFTLDRVRYDSHEAQQLIAELQEEYTERYGGPDETPVDPDEFEAPDGAFFVAHRDGELVGCAGMRRFSTTEVEVKRMFIRRPFRGRGWSRTLLALVEDEARALGFSRILMETGLRQPEAMALYESSGYEPIPGFGHYRDAPGNRCYAKQLNEERSLKSGG
ncbi:MAG TPA: GNAT family N-acetyltransferase [Actinomycetes bacterium]|nr:GNAT family N-acetyltransferase [Actinomycetes bacterium]